MVTIIIKWMIFMFLVAGVSMLCTAIYNLVFGDQIGPFDVISELFAIDDDDETDYVIID